MWQLAAQKNNSHNINYAFISVINLGWNANFLAMRFGTFPQMKPNVFRRHLRNEIAMSRRFIRMALNNGSGLCVHCDEILKRARCSRYNSWKKHKRNVSDGHWYTPEPAVAGSA